MRLTVTAEYAVRTILYLSRSLGRAVRLDEIAEQERIPEASLRSLLRWLKAKGLVRFQLGREGGYILSRDPEQLHLRDILEAVEGPLFVDHCLLHGAPCPAEREHWCPMHDFWESAARAFLKTLEGHSVAEMGMRVRRWRQVESE